MFCRNCGTELSEGTKFCPKCGAAVEEQKPLTQPSSQPGGSAEMHSTPAPAPANKSVQSNASNRRSVLFGVIGAVVVLALAVLSIVTEIIKPEALLLLLVLGLLIGLAIRPYFLAVTLPKKNQAGIPCGLTAAQIIDILTRSPWCEGQKISTEDTLIPKTQRSAQIVFEGIRTKTYLYTENSRLYAYSYNLLKVTNFQRSFWAHQEAQMLLRYITALEQGNMADAENIRKKSSSTIARRVGIKNFTAIAYCLALLALIVVLVLKEQGIITPVNQPASPSSTDKPADTRSTAEDLPDTSSTDEPKDNMEPAVATASPDAPYLGEYKMVSEYGDATATLNLYYSNNGEIYADGIANYLTHVGEVFGAVQIIDGSHLSYEEDGNCLDITYDAAVQSLIVEETGSFGGVGVTFAGTYTRSGSEPDSNAAESAQSNGPSDADVAAALAEIIPTVVAVPGQWSVNEWGTVSITPRSTVSGAFSISGSVDIMMAQAGDGSWFAEASDSSCTITYNYADEYYEDAANQRGFVIDSTVKAGGGIAVITVTPLDFTHGSDPTGMDYSCYLEWYDGAEGVYILRDANYEIGIFLDENMEPCAFSYEF